MSLHDHAKDGCKPTKRSCMPGAGLSESEEGKAPFEMPALKPYWGKPTVRNFRGDGGNGGIIRSPLSVSILLDRLRESLPFVFFHTSRKNVTCMSAVPTGLRMNFWFRQPHAEARG